MTARPACPITAAWLLALPIALALLVAACGARRTQLVVRVASDMAQGPGQLLTAVRAEVAFEPDAGAQDQLARPLASPDAGGTHLPGDIAIFVPDGIAAVTVRVTAVHGDTDLLTVTRTVPAPAGQVSFLDVFLAECAAPLPARPCPSRMRCGDTGCMPDPNVIVPSTCGNGHRDDNETCGNCPEDIGPRDGVCGLRENCGNCPEDCGACSVVCPMRHDCHTCADTEGCGWCGGATTCAPCRGSVACDPIAPCDAGWVPVTSSCP